MLFYALILHNMIKTGKCRTKPPLTAMWERERTMVFIWQEAMIYKKGAEEGIDKSDSAKANRYIGLHN